MALPPPVDNPTVLCFPSRPCNRWRTCARCARRRQAKVADAVADLANRVGHLRWHIMYPANRGQDALRAVRENWLRSAAPAAAVWSVEQSRKTGALHLNVITPAAVDNPPKNAEHWHQIITGEVRHVGAYIVKPGQAPRPESYAGRLYGTAGHLWHVLANQHQYPAVAAAATQYALDSHAMLNRAVECLERNKLKSFSEHEADRAMRERPAPQSREQLRAIASRWLPDLLDWKEKNRPKSAIEIAQEWVKHEEN